MRKLFIILLTIMILFLSNRVYPKEESVIVTVNLRVAEIFELTIDSPFIDFGELDPGEVSIIHTIEIRGRSNTGNSITIQQKGNDFISGLKVIDVENVEYEIEYVTGTTGIIPHNPQEMKNTYQTIYRKVGPAPVEMIDVTLNSSYTIEVPDNALSGDYTSIFTVTMTE